MLFISSFLDDVTFSHNGANGAKSNMTAFRRVRQVAAPNVTLFSTIVGLQFVCFYVLSSDAKNYDDDNDY